MDRQEETRRWRIGRGGDDVHSVGVLEGEILRMMWDAGESLTSVRVYEAMHFARRAEKREMQSPSTIAVTLSHMVEKGLLTVERRPRSGKGFYGPTRTRAEVVSSVLDDVSRRLTGHPLGFLLTRLEADPPKSAAGLKALSQEEASIEPLIASLRTARKSDNKPVPPHTETW